VAEKLATHSRNISLVDTWRVMALIVWECHLHIIGPNIIIICAVLLGKMKSFRQRVLNINTQRAHNLSRKRYTVT